ncbi:MAG TPA: hypothetical protein VNM48_12270, partial [Chloroflexota bacterium]|nr:hypothetical protein [Chloroflexota bacterium]
MTTTGPCTPVLPVLPNAAGGLPAAGADVAQITCRYSWTTAPTTALADGPATVTVTGYDRAGNGIVTIGTILLDNTPPATTISTPLAGAAFTSITAPSITLTGTATDALAGVDRVEGRLTRVVNGVTTYFDGTFFVASDPGGYPMTSALNPAGGVGITSTTWTGTEPNVWLDGFYTMTVRTVDEAGNAGANTSSGFSVDAAPPSITITSVTPSPAALGNVITISVSVMDTVGGVGAAPAVTLAQNGAPAAAATLSGCSAAFPSAAGATVVCTYTYTVTGPPDGIALISATVSDTNGSSATDTETVFIGTTAPVLDIVVPTVTVYRKPSQTVDVTFTYTEASPREYVVQLKPPSSAAVITQTVSTGIPAGTNTITRTLTLTGIADGVYDVIVSLTNAAGQTVTDTEVGRVVVDSTPPLATVSTPGAGTTVGTLAVVNGTASDSVINGASSGLATVRFSVRSNVVGFNNGMYWNGATWVTSASNVWLTTNNETPNWTATAVMPALSTLQQGSYTICASALDVVGNQQTNPLCNTFTLNKPPMVTAAVPDTDGAVVARGFAPVTITFSEPVFKNTGSLVQISAADYGTLISLRQDTPTGTVIAATAT